MRLKNNKKHSIKRKVLFCFTMFLFGIIISFKELSSLNKNINNKYNDLLLEMAYKSVSNKTYFDLLEKEEESKSNLPVDTKPLIYIYNTHDKEEYKSTLGFSPTVKVVNNVLKEKFESSNIPVLTEERSVRDLLNLYNWSYSYSYKASRQYLDEVKINYPTIKYFIDVHRDSLEKNRTTVTINNKDYATILFIVGLDNPNYQPNLEFTEKINNKINEKYPTLSKGILKKSGAGVNGVYNQDSSPNCILVEVGGYQNNIYEVLNTALAFSDCFQEVINEN